MSSSLASMQLLRGSACNAQDFNSKKKKKRRTKKKRKKNRKMSEIIILLHVSCWMQWKRVCTDYDFDKSFSTTVKFLWDLENETLGTKLQMDQYSGAHTNAKKYNKLYSNIQALHSTPFHTVQKQHPKQFKTKTAYCNITSHSMFMMFFGHQC